MKRPRQFLPPVAGADVPQKAILPVPAQTNVQEGNGPLAGSTENFALNLVNFDWITWHNYEWENWIQVDALLQIAVGYLNLRGLWRPGTPYLVGQTVIDPNNTNTFWLCEISHTSGTDFDVDKPLYWSERVDAQPLVTSVFGRIGDVVPVAGDYDAFYYTQAEIDIQQSIQDDAILSVMLSVDVVAADLTAHENDTSNPHDTDWDGLLGKPATFPPSAHTHVEDEITDLDRTRWVYPYVFGASYETDDVVNDSNWLMAANTDTNDRAAPQPIGNEQYIFPGAPAWVVEQNANRVLTGIDVQPLVNDVMAAVGYRFWAENQDPGYSYEIWIEDRRNPSAPVFTKILDVSGPQTAAGWNTLSYNGPLMTTDDDFRVWLATVNSSAYVPITGSWVTGDEEQSAGPAAGQWNRNNQSNVLRISKTDDSSNDRAAELVTITAGNALRIEDPTAPLRYAMYNTISDPVDEGTYYEWEVNLVEQGSWGTPYAGLLTTIIADVATEIVTDYVEEVDGTLALPAVQGVLSTTGKFSDAVLNDNAYGIDILFQRYELSPDWDIMAAPGGGGGGGRGSDGPSVPVEIVEADTTAGWQVWGDTLIQWGVLTSAANGIGIADYDQPFKALPSVSAIVYHAGDADETAKVVAPENTTTRLSLRTFRSGALLGPLNVTWIAVGEAPDALKKPKTVQTIGGSVLQEYHDPAGAASWRIVGTTLECWGIVSDTGDTLVNYPKTFARVPTVTMSFHANTPDNANASIAGTPTVSQVVFRRLFIPNGSPAQMPVLWHAIGEWDGVS